MRIIYTLDGVWIRDDDGFWAFMPIKVFWKAVDGVDKWATWRELSMDAYPKTLIGWLLDEERFWNTTHRLAAWINSG